jgi:hypothetical protein
MVNPIAACAQFVHAGIRSRSIGRIGVTPNKKAGGLATAGPVSNKRAGAIRHI